MKKISSETLFILIFTLVILAINSCGNTGPVSPSGSKLEYSNFTKLVTQSIGISGGKITHTSSDSLNGLTIEVPNAGLKDSRTFEISTAPITKNSFGSDFLPLTPIIRISNGGGYADSIMTLEIPIKLPEGYFPMAFYYDSETGELEGIPAGAVTPNKIYIGTCHLDGKKLSDGKSTKIMANQNWADIIVAAVKLDELNGIYDSGFKPGVDDWEFPNPDAYGSWGKFCSGESLSEMWYYSVKKLKEKKPPLYGLYGDVVYDVPDKMWHDNVNGIKLASMVWRDYEQTSDHWNKQQKWLDKFEGIGTKKFTKDSLHYFSFLYALKVIGKPQLICTNQHAMVCYGGGNGFLNIADPEEPCKKKTAIFANGDLLYGYFNRVPTYHVKYWSKSSFIDFDLLENRWNEFESGTIGKGVYPELLIQYKDKIGNLIDFSKSISIDIDTIRIIIECPDCKPGNDGTKQRIIASILDVKGNRITFSSTKICTLMFDVKDKINQQLGLYIEMKPIDPYGEIINTYCYTDFKWFTITRQPKLSIESGETDGDPIKKAGVKDKNYTFILNDSGTVDNTLKIEWDFGDGSSKVTKIKDTTIQHTFTKDGTYEIRAKAFDNSTGVLIGEAKATAKIQPDSVTIDLVNILNQTLDIYTEVYMGKFNRDTKTVYDDNSVKSTELKEQLSDLLLNSTFFCNNEKLSWTFQQKKINFVLTGYQESDYSYYSTTFSGEIDTNTMTMNYITGSRMIKAKKVNPNGSSDSTVITFKLNNLTVEKTYNPNYEIFFCVRFDQLTKDVMNYVDEISKFEYRYDGIDNSDSKKRGMYTTVKQNLLALPNSPSSYMRLWFVKQK